MRWLICEIDIGFIVSFDRVDQVEINQSIECNDVRAWRSHAIEFFSPLTLPHFPETGISGFRGSSCAPRQLVRHFKHFHGSFSTPLRYSLSQCGWRCWGTIRSKRMTTAITGTRNLRNQLFSFNITHDPSSAAFSKEDHFVSNLPDKIIVEMSYRGTGVQRYFSGW